MMIKQKLTEVAVDAITDYVKEKIEWLKKFDLDQDGRKDVDQIIEIVVRCGQLTKESIDHTNFAQIAAGLDQIMTGASLIKSSVDQEKLAAMSKELGAAWHKLGHLAQLSIQYAKDNPQSK
ncbi:MAG: hypothetical protein K2W95_17080 [Candidatus Obscuribacterales bacterium]|nr:hypothetical protein [Candidatus Obscuribacterales bacterium]